MVSSSSAPGRRAQFELLFEDDSGKVYSWRAEAEVHLPLQKLASMWTQEHLKGDQLKGEDLGEDPQVATLRDPESDDLLDLSLTPQQLWEANGGCRKLWIEPKDSYLEGTPVEKQAPASSPLSTPQATQVTTSKRAAVAEVVPAAEAAAGASKRARVAAPAKAPAPAKAATPAAPAKAEEAAKAAAPGAQASRSSATAANRKPGLGKPPSGDDAIVYESPNPKNASSSSGIRYAAYMSAKTVKEALALGAAPGDIAHDYKKGLLRRFDA